MTPPLSTFIGGWGLGSVRMNTLKSTALLPVDCRLKVTGWLACNGKLPLSLETLPPLNPVRRLHQTPPTENISSYSPAATGNVA
jgi:hypothetical protein